VQVAEVKTETSKTQDVIRQTGQAVIETLSSDIQQSMQLLSRSLTKQTDAATRMIERMADKTKRLHSAGKS